MAMKYRIELELDEKTLVEVVNGIEMQIALLSEDCLTPKETLNELRELVKDHSFLNRTKTQTPKNTTSLMLRIRVSKIFRYRLAVLTRLLVW